MSIIWDIVILGCGQLGGNLKKHLEASGHRVLGIRRTRKPYDQTMKVLDLDDPGSCKQLMDLEISPNGVVIGIMTPDERTEQAYKVRYIGVASLIAKFLKLRTQSAVWVSSTAVFGKQQNGILDEKTLPCPDDWRGHCILEAEEFIRQSRARTSILRCAGLYTEKGISNLLTTRSRSQLNPFTVSNRIHREDVVSWLYYLVSRLYDGQSVPPLIHGVDDCPAYYSEIFRYLDGETGKINRAEGGRRIVSLYREQMPTLLYPEIR